MERAQARSIAKEWNARNTGVSYKAERQYWRDGHHWYVKGSDGTGTFLARAAPEPK